MGAEGQAKQGQDAPIAELNPSLPEGYRIELGGVVAESAASQDSVFAVVPIMLLLTLSLLFFQLKSFARLFRVLSLVALGLIGMRWRPQRRSP